MKIGYTQRQVRILLTVFVLSLLSTPVFAEWTKVCKNAVGTIYVDFETIRKHDGYVYWWELTNLLRPTEHDGYVFWWELTDLLKPTETGILSAKTYHQGDCKLFRHKTLSFSFHKRPMGGGIGDVQEPIKKGWNYSPPNSSSEDILKSVCAYAK